jgi:hypothetical protein
MASPLHASSSPRVVREALAGIGASDIGEFALESGGKREAVEPFHLGRASDQCRVTRLCRAIDDKGRARQRLEGRRDIAIGLKSCAQTARPRSVKMPSCIANDLSPRRPSSLQVAVTLLAA